MNIQILSLVSHILVYVHLNIDEHPNSTNIRCLSLYKGGVSVLVGETIYKTNGLGTSAEKNPKGGQIPK